MTRNISRIACLVLGLIGIAACTAPGTMPEGDDQDTLALATRTLQHTRLRANPAVESLMRQADELIESNNLELAEDKIERALRITPDYAPGWSRLSRIALQKQDPVRAIQMASRSNDCAGDAHELKRLNWNIIRDARLSLNDGAGVEQAEATLRGLR